MLDPEWPPLDIKKVAEAISFAWRDAFDSAASRYMDDVDSGMPPHFTVDIREQSRFADRVMEILTQYDAGRSEYLVLLKREVMWQRSIQPMYHIWPQNITEEKH